MRGVRKRTPWIERRYQEISNMNEDGGCILEYGAKMDLNSVGAEKVAMLAFSVMMFSVR